MKHVHFAKMYTVALFLILAVFLAACSNNGGETADPVSNNPDNEQSAQPNEPENTPQAPEVTPPPQDPVKLTIYDTLFTDDEFQQFIEEPVSKKYPYISFERIKYEQGGYLPQIQNFIAANSVPDIILMTDFYLQMLNQLDLTIDLDDLIKSRNADLSVLDPIVIDTIKNLSGTGEMVAMPLYKNIVATFYNKELFDKFNVPYPEDGMTYEQVVELARKLTQSEGGVDYLGMFPGGWNLQKGQLALTVLDAKSGEPVVTESEGFTRIFQLNQEIGNISGMQKIANGGQARNLFFKDKRLAILIDWTGEFLTTYKQSDAGVDWDMVTMPVFSDHPNAHSQSTQHDAILTSTCKHKEAAFDVISYLATSKEVQTIMSQEGRVTVLSDTAVNDVFGTAIIEGKNIDVLKKTNLVPTVPTNPLEFESQLVYGPMNNALNKMLDGKADINTVLREAAELIKQNLAGRLGN